MKLQTSCKWLAVAVATMAVSFADAQDRELEIEHLSDSHTFVRVNTARKYILLPVQESAPEATINIVADTRLDQTINVRLAINKADYYVPFELTPYQEMNVILDINQTTGRETARNAREDACWKEIKTSDSFDTANREKFRGTFHFSPAYGWMNDSNGMVYKDGVYHLFYQHNPYGSMWGNMNWGHAASTDLVHWTHMPVAIAPNALGTVFSGSAVVDKDNTAGFGANAIVAMYTSAGKDQTQSLAYSTDNGKTFHIYEKNPVITYNIPDFRDPKLFWNDETGKWNVVLASGQEVRYYSSPNLKDWTYESSFGHGYGNHDGVWECPDMIKVPVEGTNESKWVLILNINPGGPFGGSATQYFTGDFDGHKFTCDSKPETTKWMDYGKDHYATVTWSNAPHGRHIALAWMSNWQYANDVPTQQFRSSNSIPRDLYLYKQNGETYLASAPSREMEALRGKAVRKGGYTVSGTKEIRNFLAGNKGTYEILLNFQSGSAGKFGCTLSNKEGEKVVFTYNMSEGTLAVDRTRSGKTDFSKDFPVITKAPVPQQKLYQLRLIVDKSSIEAFGDNGKVCLTNLVFPTSPYDDLTLFSQGGKSKVTGLTIYPLD